MPDAVSRERARALEGPEKVAALLLSVEKDVARRLLRHFDQADLRQIAKAAAGLGSLGAEGVSPLFDEFIAQLTAGGASVVGSATQAEELLAGVVPPEQIAEIMSDVRGASNELFWRRLSAVSDELLSSYLAAEHPQTIAVVLSKVDSAFAARILGRLPAQARNAAMQRMLTSRPASDAALRLLEATLDEDLTLNASAGAGNGANARVAGIINQMESEQKDDILQSIAQAQPAIAEKLKSLLFTFEDIPKLDARARMLLFDQIPTDRVILALRGAQAALREAVLPALSARTRRMVEAELSAGDMPQRRDILAAQRLISDRVLALAEQGTIDIAEGGADG